MLAMHANKFVESYFNAWNHRDPVAVADHLAANGVYCDVPENVQRTHDELIVTLSDFFANYRHRYELIGEILQGDNTIAFQYKMFPLGKASKSEAGDVINGAEFMTLNGDAAMTITDYYDMPGRERSSELARATSQQHRNHKYAKSGLNEQQLTEYKTRLAEIMQSQQVFLQPDMTLPKLAQAVGCSVNHLSQVINAGFEMSFFDYLNNFRIEHAKALLARSDGQNGAVLNVAFTVGFNSNSAFYAAFKKCVGQTPAQYRRAQLRKSH
jgi:AraC-like DNA-binding protein